MFVCNFAFVIVLLNIINNWTFLNERLDLVDDTQYPTFFFMNMSKWLRIFFKEKPRREKGKKTIKCTSTHELKNN